MKCDTPMTFEEAKARLGIVDRQPIPMTNEEWIKQCTTEQLADWIVHLADDCTMQHECNLCNSWCDEKRVIEWLKQPHTNE